MAEIAAKGISKSFGPSRALAGVDFAAQGGEVHALVGENGSGKSTLMTILAGEAKPDQGQMTLDGRPYTPRNPVEASTAGVSLIHQELALCPHLSAADNIWLGRETAIGTPRQREAKAKAVLEDMGFPDVPAGAPVSRLPIAMRQTVEVARAWASSCRICLFDEPTSSLSREDALRLFALIGRLKERGTAIVYISHFLEEARQIAQKVSILRDGEMIATAPLGGLSDDEIIRHMVGREVTDLYPRSVRPRGELVLEVESLAGDKLRPSGATFRLHRGEVVGVAGLSGAGRSELLRSLFGLRAIASGVLKTSCFSGSPNTAKSWRGKVGFVSEDRKAEGLAVNLPIADNVVLPSLAGFLQSPRALAARGDEMVKRLRIKARSASQPIRQLSGGNQQKAALARLMDSDSSLCILDEPTRGIDVGSKAEIYRLIDGWAMEGRTVLIAGSHLPELLGICDRILVMSRGRLVGEVDARQADQEALLAMCLS